MKILLVEPFARIGGHPTANAKYLSQAFADAGSDVTLITFEGVLGDWIEKDARIKHLSALSEAGIFAPMLRSLSYLLRSMPFLSFFSPAFDTFFTFLLTLRQIRRRRYDVVHIVDACRPPLSFLAFASAVKNCNLVHTLYGEQNLLQEGKKFSSALKTGDCLLCLCLLEAKLEGTKLMAAVKKFLYQRAIKRNRIAFTCFSKAEHDTYKDSVFYQKIVCVLPPHRRSPPVLTRQEARQYLGLPKDRKIFLSFGINHPSKSYEVMFQAVQSLPRDFKLLFAGRMLPGGINQNDPGRLAQEYSLIENTIVVDRYIPDEEAPYYFCAADALILSYRKEFLQHSGNMIYACQCNLPVIASASEGGQLGEDVRSYNLGLTFTPDDPHSLQQAILSFLKLGGEEKQAMKKGLQGFASDYSWEQMTKSHLELYQSLLGR